MFAEALSCRRGSILRLTNKLAAEFNSILDWKHCTISLSLSLAIFCFGSFGVCHICKETKEKGPLPRPELTTLALRLECNVSTCKFLGKNKRLDKKLVGMTMLLQDPLILGFAFPKGTSEHDEFTRSLFCCSKYIYTYTQIHNTTTNL